MMSYILYGCIWLLSLLPLRILYCFSDILYYILYYLFRYRRKVVRRNLCRSFPEKSVPEIVQIEKKFYHHLCDLFVEMYRLWNMSEKEIRRRCIFKHTEILEKYYAEGRGVVGVLGHYGNWEWMTSYPLWVQRGIDFYPLYKPLHNRAFDRMMLKIRSRFGAVPVPKNDILRMIVKDRREGKVFLGAFIGDQTPNRRNLNFWTRFLNQDTPVLLGTEKIARKFNLPVISLHMRMLKRGYYEVDFVDVCADPASLAPGELTELHTRILEQQIREVPELWLWSHKRWKHKRIKQEKEGIGQAG